MAQPISLLIRGSSGQILGVYPLTPAGELLNIAAADNAYYELVDASGYGPAQANGKRYGDDLLLTLDDRETFFIMGYFRHGQGALVGMQADGVSYFYPIDSGEAAHLHAAEIGSSSAASGKPTLTALSGMVTGIALTASGIAIAHHHRHDFLDTTESPQSNPQPNHVNKITLRSEAKSGATLTTHFTDSEGFDPAQVDYQWLRDGAPISEQTGATYTLTSDDTGRSITEHTSYIDHAAHSEAPSGITVGFVGHIPVARNPLAFDATDASFEANGKGSSKHVALETGRTLYTFVQNTDDIPLASANHHETRLNSLRTCSLSQSLL